MTEEIEIDLSRPVPLRFLQPCRPDDPCSTVARMDEKVDNILGLLTEIKGTEHDAHTAQGKRLDSLEKWRWIVSGGLGMIVTGGGIALGIWKMMAG